MMGHPDENFAIFSLKKIFIGTALSVTIFLFFYKNAALEKKQKGFSLLSLVQGLVSITTFAKKTYICTTLKMLDSEVPILTSEFYALRKF